MAPAFDRADGHHQISGTILVVEDDPSISQVLQLALRRAGFEVIGVTDGAQALNELDRSRVVAVMLDLGLPDGRTRDVLARLRNGGGQGSPGWLALSALDPGDAERQYGPLGNRLLPKPFDAWAAVRRIKDMLLQGGALPGI